MSELLIYGFVFICGVAVGSWLMGWMLEHK